MDMSKGIRCLCMQARARKAKSNVDGSMHTWRPGNKVRGFRAVQRGETAVETVPALHLCSQALGRVKSVKACEKRHRLVHRATGHLAYE